MTGGAYMKKIAAGLVSLALILSLCGVPAMASKEYTDVKKGAWYESFVQYVVEKGLMTGTSETAFAPNKQVTRAELVQTLYAMAGKPGVVKKSYYKDLNQNWYKNAVVWASCAGVTRGLDYEHFGPSNGVTREQVATFLRAYSKRVEVRNVTEASDIGIYRDASAVSEWAKDSIKWAVAKGLLNSASTKEKTLNPKGIIKRSELATILTKYSQLEYSLPKEANQNLYKEVLEELNGRQFTFASGAGAWSNVLEVRENGSFIGYYHDSDTYEVAFCKYSGIFFVKKKIDDNTYILGIKDLKIENTPGESFWSKEFLMTAAAPYGLENSGDVYLYLPGTPTKDLPEAFREWNPNARKAGALAEYGLYNINEQQGWCESDSEYGVEKLRSVHT